MGRPVRRPSTQPVAGGNDGSRQRERSNQVPGSSVRGLFMSAGRMAGAEVDD